MLAPVRLSISIDVHRLCCQLGCKPTTWRAGKELGYALSVPWKQKEAEFKNNGLTYLVKDISRHHSLQATAWLLLATCGNVYNEKSDQKWDRKMWRMCSLAKKGAEECLKFGLSNVKEVSVTKEKSSLHTRTVSKVSLEQDLTYWRLQGIKTQNKLKGRLLRR